MRAVLVCLLALILCASASHIRRFSQDDLRPNQYLIFDDDDTSILVDTGVGSEQGNLDLVDFIRSQGVTTLQAIFITHGHPDHFGGIPFLAETFPDAVIEVGTRDAHDELVANAVASFPDVEFDWDSKVKIQDDDEFYDELDLLILSDFSGAESSFYSMVHNADDNYIITGDALTIDFHPYLGIGVNLQFLRNWYGVTLEIISDGGDIGLNKNTVYYPGHGPRGDYLQVDVLNKYLRDFEDLVLSCPNTEFPIKLETVKTSIIEDYPEFEGRSILDLMVQNFAWVAAQNSANPCAFFDQFSSNNGAETLTFSVFTLLTVAVFMV